MSSANVTSLDAIRRMREALHVFRLGASDAIAAVQLELQRAIEWIQHDRPKYWELQVRRGWENLAEARSNLERCQIQVVAGHTPACREEKIALQRAKSALRHAEEMIDVVKHWQRTVTHESSEFVARLAQLSTWVDGDCPRAIAALGRMLTALEEYVAMIAPTDAGAAAEAGAASMSRGEAETQSAVLPETAAAVAVAELDAASMPAHSSLTPDP